MHPKTHKTIESKELNLKGHMSTCCNHPPSPQHRESRQKCPSPKKGVTLYIDICCLRVHLQGCGYTLLGAGCDPPWSPGELVGISATFSFQFAPTIKSGGQHVSRKRLYICLASPFADAAQGTTGSDSQMSLHSQVLQDYSKQ